jgi:hypothetical protein
MRRNIAQRSHFRAAQVRSGSLPDAGPIGRSPALLEMPRPMNPGTIRIAIIADTYPPLRMSGAVQMRDLVQAFSDEGHEPTVIVPTSGLDCPWRIERDGRITVLRVRTLPTKDVGHVRRVIAEMLLPFILLRAVTASGLRGVRWGGGGVVRADDLPRSACPPATPRERLPELSDTA